MECETLKWAKPWSGSNLFRLFATGMFSLVILGLGCVFASVPGFFPRQQTQSPAILSPNFGQHTFPFSYRAPNQFQPRTMSLPPPPITMMTQDMRKPITSSEEAHKALEGLMKQQEITADVLRRIERTFDFSTKASMELQNQQARTQKTRIQGSPEMGNFWTNRPEEIYVAEIVHEAGFGDSEDEVMVALALEIINDDDTDFEWHPVESKKKASTKKKGSKASKKHTERSPKKTGGRKSSGKDSTKPHQKATAKRVRSSGGDNRPQKKQRKVEKAKENIVPRITRAKNTQRK